MAAARVGLGRRLGKTPFLEAALRSPITLRAQCISTALDPANWHGLGLTLALTNVAAGDHWLTARVRRCLREHHSIPVLVSGLGSVSFVVRPWGATWRYRDNGTAPPATWTQLSFNDSAWKSGPAELGYGDFDETTVVEDNPTPGYNSGDTNRYITTWFRRTFTVANAAQVTALAGRMIRDDGVAVYLNGTEIWRDNLAAGAGPTTLATSSISGTAETTQITKARRWNDKRCDRGATRRE